MKVKVLAFARVRELLGGDRFELDVRDGATAEDAWAHLAQRCAGLLPLAGSTRIARNGRLLSDRAEPLSDGDELALLPPVGGG